MVTGFILLSFFFISSKFKNPHLSSRSCILSNFDAY